MIRGLVLISFAVMANAQFFYHPRFRTVVADDAGPEPCPKAPARPDGVAGCNWIAIQNDRGCILDYECEPKGPEPCPATPVQPEESFRCKWTAIKNSKGCIVDFECEPRQGGFNGFAASPFGFGGFPYGYNVIDVARPVIPVAPQVIPGPAVPLTTAGLTLPAAPQVAVPAAQVDFGGFDYNYWQQYFQAAFNRGIVGAPQGQGAAQQVGGQQQQDQQFNWGRGQQQGFGGQQQFAGQQQGFGGFQGQQPQQFQGQQFQGQQFQGQQPQQFQGQQNWGQQQVGGSYRPQSGAAMGGATAASEYVWVYPEGNDGAAGAPAEAAEGAKGVEIPTGAETIPSEIGSGMPLTTGFGSRGAGTPAKKLKL